MSWKTCRKMDAHVHVLPGERAAMFPADEGPEACWSRCSPYLYDQDPRETNRILRAFGPERLLFGTDFPQGEYSVYFDLLDQMDFSEEEIERIAWKNMERLLAGEGRP